MLECSRGAFNTQAASHAQGDSVSKLADHAYRVFLTNPELSIEMAQNIAELFNETGLRQISFDGLEGNRSTGLGNYGEVLFTQAWYDHLTDDIRQHYIADASRTSHFFWHMYTRMNWGEPWYAGFRESQTEYRLKNQEFFRRNLLPKFPVYLDSPMAIEATKIYARHVELFDADFQALQKERPLSTDLDTLKPCVTAEESKALNHLRGPCMILAGAGMCNAGRIVHHLRQNLWHPETVVIIVGFQARGTLGRLLVDGSREVKIFGDRIAVNARIRTLGGFSAHAGQTHLLNWLGAMAPSSPRVILTHGEERARQTLTERIKDRFQLVPELPEQGAVIEI